MIFHYSHQSSSRNSIIGDQYRWPTTIPYYLEDNLGKTPCHRNSHSHYIQRYYGYDSSVCLAFYRHECKGSDPEGFWPVQTEDLHRLHAVERRGQLHLCVQRQRVSPASNFKLDIDETCQVLSKCFLVESVSECNTTVVKTNPRFPSQFVRCNVAWCANYKQNSPQQFDVLNLVSWRKHACSCIFVFLAMSDTFCKIKQTIKMGLNFSDTAKHRANNARLIISKPVRQVVSLDFCLVTVSLFFSV